MSTISLSESLLGKPTHAPKKFETLLRSPVAKDDRTEVMNYLRDAERDYRNGQVEINKCKAMILMLESKREGIKKSMERYRSLLSPVYRLPSELLSEIFGYCCEYNFLDLAMPPAISLSMVCGRWREIVLSSPRLWSSITIMGLRYHNYQQADEGTDEEDVDEEELHRDRVTNRIRLCLERSKSAPLALNVTIHDNSWDEHDLGYIVMRLLAEHSERWEKFTFTGPEFYASSVAGEINLPILSHLRLMLLDRDSLLPLDRFRNCPVLSSVDTDTTDRLQLPWASIRALRLTECTDSSVLPVLSSCLNLEELRLFEHYDSYDQTPRREMIMSDTIKTLSILSIDSDSEGQIVQHFTFPRLSSIDIVHPRMSPLHLQQLIQRSSCSITSLSLNGPRLTDPQLSSLLRLMPELRMLDIGNCEGYPISGPRFLEHLVVNPDDHQMFLPHLMELKIELAGEQVDEQTLTNALTSRLFRISSVSSSIGVDRLKSLNIRFWWDFEIPPEAFPSLQYLGDFGLELNISHCIFCGY
ncbi:hypothetical protein E1B28_009752 [Marasmius oreades]|uniref:F-box domain-containing protein n=1 Tax=Marasmius oreades TaxID=181124 RepID=A0A9P7RWU1_9AGAR|nr:uncharacterized protein E1B28_009752 [Marasmius oreades]KAG7090651.1 hypothetical protein E1B28_009752 [Marasmius oreades]